jgi:GT2 family glycosyltransferase
MPDEPLAVLARSEPLFTSAAEIMSGRAVPRREDGARELPLGRYELLATDGPRRPGARVSVVVPTFERPSLVTEAVASAASAADVGEVIVVNDSPAPLPKETRERLAAQPVNVLVVQHRANLGLGAARNTGSSLARGEWLLLLDDDDTLVPGSIETLLRSRDGTAAEFVFGDHVRQWYEGASPSSVERRSIGPRAIDELRTENLVVCGSFLIRRDLFDALGGYREDLPVHEDYNLHLRALAAAPWSYVETPVSIYHMRSAIPRLNDRRLLWFATCAFNHALYRSLFRDTDDETKRQQREYQYAHVARALREGCTPSVARAVVERWWETLRAYGLASDVTLDETIIPSCCPALVA